MDDVHRAVHRMLCIVCNAVRSTELNGRFLPRSQSTVQCSLFLSLLMSTLIFYDFTIVTHCMFSCLVTLWLVVALYCAFSTDFQFREPPLLVTRIEYLC